jgi:large subunit ribosomal protein L22
MGTKTANKTAKRNTADSAAEFRSIHWHAKGSPQKARRVMDKIRGLMVSDALDQLRNMHQKSAFQIDKLLKSAIANADKAIEEELIRSSDGTVLDPQPEVDVDDLYIHEAKADEGPRHKRWRPRARGAAFPYRKYFSHLTIRLRPVPSKEQ